MKDKGKQKLKERKPDSTNKESKHSPNKMQNSCTWKVHLGLNSVGFVGSLMTPWTRYHQSEPWVFLLFASLLTLSMSLALICIVAVHAKPRIFFLCQTARVLSQMITLGLFMVFAKGFGMIAVLAATLILSEYSPRFYQKEDFIGRLVLENSLIVAKILVVLIDVVISEEDSSIKGAKLFSCIDVVEKLFQILFFALRKKPNESQDESKTNNINVFCLSDSSFSKPTSRSLPIQAPMTSINYVEGEEKGPKKERSFLAVENDPNNLDIPKDPQVIDEEGNVATQINRLVIQEGPVSGPECPPLDERFQILSSSLNIPVKNQPNGQKPKHTLETYMGSPNPGNSLCRI